MERNGHIPRNILNLEAAHKLWTQECCIYRLNNDLLVGYKNSLPFQTPTKILFGPDLRKDGFFPFSLWMDVESLEPISQLETSFEPSKNETHLECDCWWLFCDFGK